MNLTAGMMVMNEGAAVRLLSFQISIADYDFWWVELLFTKPETRMMKFGRHTAYRELHMKAGATIGH